MKQLMRPHCKVTPEGDNRSRVNTAVKLWVLNRGWSKDKTYVESCGVIESIERIVYLIEGKSGRWVRYSNHYYPLHTAEEFSELLAKAKKKIFYFFNNVIGKDDVAAVDQTAQAPFIYWDEEGPYA